MAEPTPKQPARRIVVALDTSEASRVALEAAARLAAARGAELIGVFVEEDEVLRAASFPFSRVLGTPAAGWKAVDAATMTRALRTRAKRLQAEIARAATFAGVPWRFRTARGELADALSRESLDAELLALGRSTTRRRHRARLGRGARSTMAAVRTSVLVVGATAAQRQPIAVVYEGDGRVLARAAELAAVYGAPVRVAALGRDRAGATELARQATAWLREHAADGTTTPVVACDATALAERLSGERVALVVVDPAGPMIGAADLDDWLDRLDQPALVAR